MKFSRSTLTISLLVNLVLLAAAGILFSRPVPKPIERVVTKTVVTNETALVVVTNFPPQVLKVQTQLPFDWSMVAAADLEIYVKNLRAISCPEDTIRDIITPEVDEIFLKKLTEKLDPMRQGFWTILANWKTQEKEMEERMNGIEKLGDERREMLKKLLGAEKDSSAGFNPSERNQEKLVFLPKEKQEQMLALTKEYNDRRVQIQKDANGKPLTPEQKKTVEDMRKKMEEDRKALMTPEEFEEWQLRGSREAALRNNLVLDCTPEEMRALVKNYSDYMAAHPVLDKFEGNPNHAKETAPLQTELDEQMKKLLGEERFADFQRGRNSDFLQAYKVTERYNLPRETAVKVYEIQQSSTKLANELRKSKDLSDDERFEALSVLQEETQRNVTQTLGVNAAKTYQKYGGSWIEGLGGE